MEKKEEVKVEKVSEELMVLEELPQQQVRKLVSEDGKKIFNISTRDEALTEILTIVREIKKAVSG